MLVSTLQGSILPDVFAEDVVGYDACVDIAGVLAAYLTAEGARLVRSAVNMTDTADMLALITRGSALNAQALKIREEINMLPRSTAGRRKYVAE